MQWSRRRFLQGLALCPLCAGAARAGAAPHWDYEGHDGPDEWDDLTEEFKVCGVGTQQSPIDLGNTLKAEFNPVTLNWTPQVYRVSHNGHTIQADALKPSCVLSHDEVRYELHQFHFHTPSEHALAGARTAMEAHFVHAGPEGRLVVIGVFMKAGGTNAAFSSVMAAAPKVEGSVILDQPLDISALLPTELALFRYGGSLTTPPCAEVVDWHVFATPIEVLQADIDAFRSIFDMNARPLQPVNRRFILRRG